MQETHSLQFAPFRLDLGAEQLWRGEEARPLTRKAFATLRYLVEHAGHLVTKDDLIAAVWAVPNVSDMALASCIREIRRVLDEQAHAPQFVETVRGRGYRFLAPVTLFPPSDTPSLPPPLLLVGRDTELAHLHACYAAARQGQRQFVFITGEAGIGKTTLVDAFVMQVASPAEVWLGRGQCIEHYGVGEAYLPLLEALGQMCRGPHGTRLIEVLRHHAPSWLGQMPALLSDAEIDSLQRRSGRTTRERMLRELAEAVEVLTAERPLLLVLEDLHWSDLSTLDWIAYTARWRQDAQLLVVGTYRPVDAIIRTHPVHRVSQELQRQGDGKEVVLGYLSEAEVAVYLRQRFGEGAWLDELARVVHQRTSGNPFFVVTLIDDVMHQGAIRQGTLGWELEGAIDAVAQGLPETVHELIEQQLMHLDSGEQELLEVASTAGMEFSAAAVAAGVAYAVEDIEARCDALARRGQFVYMQETETWPDGTVAARYGFIHALYHDVFYKRVTAGRRARLHQHIGVRKEQGYGAQARQIAAELAMHFERGRDTGRAVHYLQYAGENAIQRNAHQEAIGHLTKGLEMLKTRPETRQRQQAELTMQTTLGTALVVTQGYAAPAVEQVYSRAYTLCQQVGTLSQSLPILRGLAEVYNVRKDFRKARELGEQYLTMAQRTQDAGLLVDAYYVLGLTLFYLGELPAARTHFEQGLALYDPQRYHASAPLLDSGVACLAFLTFVLAMLGYPDQALQRSHESLTLAQELAHPYSLACARYRVGLYQQFLGEAQASQKQAEETIALALERGFAFFVAVGTALKGRALCMQGHGHEGLAHIRQGLAALQTTGATPGAHWLVLQAEACGQVGQTAEALRLLAEALAFMNTTGEQNYAAELHRLQGKFLLRLAADQQSVAEICFHHALTLARRQQAKTLELRAAMSLSRLWQQQGKRAAAYQLLAEVYGWFTEGFDTADLQEARALLEALGGDAV